MNYGMNVFSLSLQRKWSYLWTCGRGSVICGTRQTKTTNKEACGTAVAPTAVPFRYGQKIGECQLDPHLTPCSSVCTVTVLVLTNNFMKL